MFKKKYNKGTSNKWTEHWSVDNYEFRMFESFSPCSSL